jgi:hypothetical protein
MYLLMAINPRTLLHQGILTQVPAGCQSNRTFTIRNIQYRTGNVEYPSFKTKMGKKQVKRQSVVRVIGHGARATRSKRRLTEIFGEFA